MRGSVMAGCLVAVALTCPQGATAQSRQIRPPKVAAPSSTMISSLERCRQITDAMQRLACYDLAAGALVQAAKAGQVRVVDRAQIQQARRSLFGFQMPKLSIFSGDSDDDKGARRLETTIKSVDQLNSGRFRIVLTEGNAIWETLESKLTMDDPRKGQKIVIVAGPLGSYFLQINGQVGIRGRRVG